MERSLGHFGWWNNAEFWNWPPPDVLVEVNLDRAKLESTVSLLLLVLPFFLVLLPHFYPHILAYFCKETFFMNTSVYCLTHKWFLTSIFQGKSCKNTGLYGVGRSEIKSFAYLVLSSCPFIVSLAFTLCSASPFPLLPWSFLSLMPTLLSFVRQGGRGNVQGHNEDSHVSILYR